ncbi:MAG: hypothetical protein R3E53_11925 [Myxococcota bacterium]
MTETMMPRAISLPWMAGALRPACFASSPTLMSPSTFTCFV